MPHAPETSQSVYIDPTQAECLSSLLAGNRYAQLDARWLRVSGKWFGNESLLILGSALFVLFLFLSSRFDWGIGTPGIVMLVLVYGAYCHFVQRRYFSRLAQAAAVPCRVSLGESGVAFLGDRTGSFVQWQAIRAVENRPDAIVLVLRNYSVRHLPHRCFLNKDEVARFFAAVVAATGLTPERQSLPAAVVPESSFKATVCALLNNIRAGALLLLFQRKGAMFLRASVPQYVLLLMATLLFRFGLDFARIGWAGEFNWGALPYLLWGIPIWLLCAWIAAGESKEPGRVVLCAVALAAISLLVNAISLAYYFLPNSLWQRPYAYQIGTWLPVVWYALAALRALFFLGPVSSGRRMAVFLVFGFSIWLGVLVNGGPYDGSLWQERYDATKYEAKRKQTRRTTQEAVLYAQPDLLAEALRKVAPERPGVADLYLVAMAGYGSQDVFLREVKSVSALFAERFDSAGHAVELINNPATVLSQPIASVTALERTLDVIGKRMNRDEDVLFLFMTSHGAEKSFSLQLWPYQFDDLTPARLKEMLDGSRIKNRVIVVSACYSGSFIEPLMDDNTLVITASRADHNSHGCSHEGEWTFFGRAYFDEALRHTLSFTAAFDEARKSIALREKDENLEPSEPQMMAGKNIGTVLEKLQQGLETHAKEAK